MYNCTISVSVKKKLQPILVLTISTTASNVGGEGIPLGLQLMLSYYSSGEVVHTRGLQVFYADCNSEIIGSILSGNFI